MTKRILTILATIAVSAAGTSLAVAQGYPQPPGPVYSAAPSAYPPGYSRPDSMDRTPDFDAIDDEQTPQRRDSAGLPPPGPVMSPDDPRYGRPEAAPVYSSRTPQPAPPQGPVLSPDDPRSIRELRSCVHPDDLPGLLAGYDLALEDPHCDTTNCEFRVIWPDGSEHWLATRGTIVRRTCRAEKGLQIQRLR